MLRILAAIFYLGLAAPAFSTTPTSLGLHFGSHHVAPGQRLEETNPGLFLNWERRLSWSLGLYRNSYGDLSWAAVVGLPIYTAGAFQAEVFGGWAHYPEEGRKFRTGVGDMIPIGGLRPGCQNKHRHVRQQRVRLHLAAYFVTAHPGHHHIQYQKVRFLVAQTRQRVFRTVYRRHRVAAAFLRQRKNVY